MKKVIGKILIIVIPILASILLLWPTYRANVLTELEKQAKDKAKIAKTQADSIAIIENFERQYGPALLSAKANRLKLGLDLRGGMYVTLEVDVVKLLEESAQKDAKDDIFDEVMSKPNRMPFQPTRMLLISLQNISIKLLSPKENFYLITTILAAMQVLPKVKKKFSTN